MVETQTRVDVANEVAAIVQRFAGVQVQRYTDAELAEQAVRDIATRAEGMTLDGEVVCGALYSRFLLDDYLRIKRGDQGDVFESVEFTPSRV